MSVIWIDFILYNRIIGVYGVSQNVIIDNISEIL